MSQSKKRSYFGAAGQMAVMSELLNLGYNVAKPEVDVGDDIISIHDEEEGFSRIQVKSANTETEESDFEVQFTIRASQLLDQYTTPFFYIFPIRHKNRWECFFIFKHEELSELLRRKSRLSDGQSGNVNFKFRKSGDDFLFVNKNPESIKQYLNCWNYFPQAF